MPHEKAEPLAPELVALLESDEFQNFVEAEVNYRVGERLRVRHYAQNALLGTVIVIATIGFALAWNSYSKIKDAQIRNERLVAALTKINAVLKVAEPAEKPAK